MRVGVRRRKEGGGRDGGSRQLMWRQVCWRSRVDESGPSLLWMRWMSITTRHSGRGPSLLMFVTSRQRKFLYSLQVRKENDVMQRSKKIPVPTITAVTRLNLFPEEGKFKKRGSLFLLLVLFQESPLQRKHPPIQKLERNQERTLALPSTLKGHFCRLHR